MQHISIRVIEHASKLDITAFENPDYYDRLERAKAQATDRIAMIQMMGTLVQQVLTTITLSVYIASYSPLLLLLLIAGTVPALLGESHFAFLGYAKNFMQTPLRRKMDYLRDVGGSKEAAKELKLFGLRDFLVSSFRGMAGHIFEQNVDFPNAASSPALLFPCWPRRDITAHMLWCCGARFMGNSLSPVFSFDLAILQVSANLQQIFVNASGVADQALFLTDLLGFFAMEPVVRSKPNAIKIPRPIRHGIEFRNVSFAYPGASAPGAERFQFSSPAWRASCADWRKRSGKNYYRETDYPIIRSDRGTNPASMGSTYGNTTWKISVMRSASFSRTLCGTK